MWTTPTYHPRANPTERRNQEIKKGLRLRLHQGNQRTWDRHLPDLLFGLRRRTNAATGATPSYLLLGQTLLGPGEWNLTRAPNAIPRAEELQQREEEARNHQGHYQARYAAAPTQPRFTTGEWVYIPNHQLSNKVAGFNAKLAPSRLGPYQILEHIAGDVYWVLKDGTAQKIHGNVLISAPARAAKLPAQAAGEEPVGRPPAAQTPDQEVRPTIAESVGGVERAHPTVAVGRKEEDADEKSRPGVRVPTCNLAAGSRGAEPGDNRDLHPINETSTGPNPACRRERERDARRAPRRQRRRQRVRRRAARRAPR